MFRNVENLTDSIINPPPGSGVQDSDVVPGDQTSTTPSSTEHVPTSPRSGTQSIERAVALLEFLGASPHSLGLSEIARAVGLTPSTTHRLLRALVLAGYVEQEPTTEQYRLGLGIAVLGQRALEHAGYHVAKPVLDELSARTGESVSLGIRRVNEVVVIEQATSSSPLRFDHATGTEIAMHASAMGKVLLANAARSIEREVAALATFDRFTDRTITAPEAVIAELAAIRARGWATNVEERHVGVCGIAAPVLARSGIAHAAIGVQGPSVRLTSERLLELAPVVTAAADEIATLVIRV